MIRLATIGTSTITRTFVDAAAAVPELGVTTAYSSDLDRAELFAREVGIPAASGDLDALLGIPRHRRRLHRLPQRHSLRAGTAGHRGR